RKLEPGLGERNRLLRESLLHPGVHRFSGELLVHPGHRQVVLGFFSNVPHDEFEPLAGIDELQAVTEHPGRGQLAISLALHHLLERIPIPRRHFLSALVDLDPLAHRASTSNLGPETTAMCCFWDGSAYKTAPSPRMGRRQTWPSGLESSWSPCSSSAGFAASAPTIAWSAWTNRCRLNGHRSRTPTSAGWISCPIWWK